VKATRFVPTAILLIVTGLTAVIPVTWAISDMYPQDSGVFARRVLSEQDLVDYEAAIASVRQPDPSSIPGDFLVDAEGLTNEILVLANGDSPELRSKLPELSMAPRGSVQAEDALVQGVRSGDPTVMAAFLNPIGARYVITRERLDSDARAGLPAEDPLEILHRYVVLRYTDIQQTQNALDALRRDLGTAVAMNAVMKFSWAPNDPYFAIKPNATNAAQYQWGLHAMHFPAAWDITQGHGYVAVVDGGIANDATAGTINDLLPNTDLRANFRLQFYTRTSYASNTTSQYHGSHVSGIIAAVANNGQGVAGACPQCSLIMAELTLTASNEASAITSSVTAGAQVINMSWGGTAAPPCPAIGSPYQVVCTALAFASNRDVLLVAAAGNYLASAPQWPAREPSVLSVAGAQLPSPGNPNSWQSWYFGQGLPANQGGQGTNVMIGTNYAGASGVVAPAGGIVSIFPGGGIQYSYAEYRCGDSFARDDSGVVNDTFGSCSGTSMAAPFISALGGMLRSINPRMSANQIKTYIRNTGNWASQPNSVYGYGMPDAASAAIQVANATTNRLAPLFSLYSSGRLDYFYSTVPQMGSTAACGFLRPRVGGTAAQNFYTSAGTTISGYIAFPSAAIPACSGSQPRAQVWIFTTPRNPISGTNSLAPLYRLSWKCGDPATPPPAVCSSNPLHMDTTYTTDPVGIEAFEDVGYRLDGIEGYIYPKSISQPVGSVRLMRKYNPARDDHAIFPETLLNAMTAEGYTQNSGSDWLGYVYVNTGIVPTIQ